MPTVHKSTRSVAQQMLSAAGVVFCACAAHAQLAHKGPQAAIALSQTLPPYDVSSVKENHDPPDSWSMNLHETTFRAVDVPLRAMIAFAYDIKTDLIVGLNGPVDSAHFNVLAKVVPTVDGTTPNLTDRELQAMVIPLLADRFHLKAHLEPKIASVYDLVVAKGGVKLKLDPSELTDNGWDINGQDTEKVLTAKSMTMEDLAAALSDETDRKVIDKTGLTGHSDITLKWSDDVATTQGGANVISIFTALEEQLGLKLQPSKGPIDTLVIDHVEMPTDN
jgi:bla regulator protein blaR1